MSAAASQNHRGVEVIWEEPDLSRKGVNIYALALQEVKKTPGRWARIRTFRNRSGAYAAARTLAKRSTDTKWQFLCARVDMSGENFGLYARYGKPTD